MKTMQSSNDIFIIFFMPSQLHSSSPCKNALQNRLQRTQASQISTDPQEQHTENHNHVCPVQGDTDSKLHRPWLADAELGQTVGWHRALLPGTAYVMRLTVKWDGVPHVRGVFNASYFKPEEIRDS